MTEESVPTDPVAAAPNKEQPASQTQAAPAFPHPDAAKKVEDAANKTAAQVNTKALSVRQWLESAVVPVVRCRHGQLEPRLPRRRCAVDHFLIAVGVSRHGGSSKRTSG